MQVGMAELTKTAVVRLEGLSSTSKDNKITVSESLRHSGCRRKNTMERAGVDVGEAAGHLPQLCRKERVGRANVSGDKN